MSLKVEVDWGGDGFDVGVGGSTSWLDDVTDRVRAKVSPVTAEYGRDQSSALAPTVSGRGAVTLDNSDRRYSPRNTASPLHGLIKPARPVRITRTVAGVETGLDDVLDDILGGLGSRTFTLFRGHTDDSPINPDIDSKTVALSMVDALADFNGQTITTELYRGVRSGQAIHYILDACGWPADLRDIDDGGSYFPWWWEDNTEALAALDKVVRSEGPPAMLTMGADGEVIFRDRHHRLTRANSTTSQGTWRNLGTLEPVMQRPFSYDEAWSHIINTATVNVDVKRLGLVEPVWTSETIITLSSRETRLISAVTTEPFYGAIAPVAGTDYTLTSGSITVSLMRTSGASATMVVTAGAAGATIATMQLRANPLQTQSTVQISASDTGSISDFGPRAFPDDLPWCGLEDARAVTEVLVSLRAQPLPIVSVRFLVGNNKAKAGLILSRDLSDRIHIIESETVLDDDFYIESIQHDLSSEHDHSVTFGLEAVPVITANPLQFDVPGSGFDQGAFGVGVDDPATAFMFDTVGHGIDEGRFVH